MGFSDPFKISLYAVRECLRVRCRVGFDVDHGKPKVPAPFRKYFPLRRHARGVACARDLDQGVARGSLRNSVIKIRETVMVWNATHIFWEEQVMLLWILLPPIFFACGLLAFAAPILYREKKIARAARAEAAANDAAANALLRKAA